MNHNKNKTQSACNTNSEQNANWFPIALCIQRESLALVYRALHALALNSLLIICHQTECFDQRMNYYCAPVQNHTSAYGDVYILKQYEISS